MDGEQHPLSEDISLKRVFIRVGGYLRAARRKWYLILLGGLLLSGVLGAIAYTTEPVYEAQITFVVNEEGPTTGAGRVGGLLGQFGLGGGGGVYNTNKILALAKSQKMVNRLLLDSLEVDGRTDLIGNHILKVYDLVEEWELAERFPDLRLSGDSIEHLPTIERSVLKRLFSFTAMGGGALISLDVDDLTDILSLTVRAENEELSLKLSRLHYDRLSEFYTLESTGNSQATVARLQQKADSIYTELSQTEYRLAGLIDTRLGVTQQRSLVQQTQLNRRVQILSVAYGEVLRNLETANFALSTNTPFFQVVDEPFLPLSRRQPNLIKQLTYGFFGGAILVFVIVAGLQFYHDVMGDNA